MIASVAAPVLSWTPRVSSVATPVLSCSAGVADCHTPLFLSGFDEHPPASCADYDGAFASPRDNDVLLAAAALVAALMAFCIGGNDSANSWASTVGSGALSLRYAVLIGGVGEWCGATALGYGVSGTIRKGVADTDSAECWACGYCDSKMSVYNVGMLGALIGATFFLLLATFVKLPVSTTHAIVGGVVGMTLVGTSADCLNWAWSGGLSAIIASWVISPLLSGVIGVALYKAVQCVALRGADPVRRSLALLPYLYALNTFVMGWLILLKSKPTEHLPPPIMLGIAVVLAVVAAAAVRFAVVPRVRRTIDARREGRAAAAASSTAAPSAAAAAAVGEVELCGCSTTADSASPEWVAPAAAAPAAVAPATAVAIGGEGWAAADAAHAFRNPLVFVAFLQSFAHGANDTANATSAFAAVWAAHSYGLYACSSIETPWWIMSAAGAFVALGVNVMGWRVIGTIGSDLARLDFVKAYTIEFASTLTVVVATVLGMPVSSTHCKVGTVVFVGALAGGGRDGGGKVNAALLGKIVASWVLTLPLAGGVAAALTVLFRAAITV